MDILKLEGRLVVHHVFLFRGISPIRPLGLRDYLRRSIEFEKKLVAADVSG